MSKWMGLLTAIVVVFMAAMVVAASVTLDYATSRPGFCRVCHEMGFYYDTWHVSAHSGMTCLACHSRPGPAGFVDTKVRALRESVMHFHGDFAVPIITNARVKNAECLACHRDAPSMPDRRRSAAHGLHEQRRVLCADCHNRLVHADASRGEPKLVGSERCEACHQDHASFPSLLAVTLRPTAPTATRAASIPAFPAPATPATHRRRRTTLPTPAATAASATLPRAGRQQA